MALLQSGSWLGGGVSRQQSQSVQLKLEPTVAAGLSYTTGQATSRTQGPLPGLPGPQPSGTQPLAHRAPTSPLLHWNPEVGRQELWHLISAPWGTSTPGQAPGLDLLFREAELAGATWTSLPEPTGNSHTDNRPQASSPHGSLPFPEPRAPGISAWLGWGAGGAASWGRPLGCAPTGIPTGGRAHNRLAKPLGVPQALPLIWVLLHRLPHHTDRTPAAPQPTWV